MNIADINSRIYERQTKIAELERQKNYLLEEIMILVQVKAATKLLESEGIT